MSKVTISVVTLVSLTSEVSAKLFEHIFWKNVHRVDGRITEVKNTQIFFLKFLSMPPLLPVRRLDLSDSHIATWQIHLDCTPVSLTSRRGPGLSTKSGLPNSGSSCIFRASS